MSTQSSIEWTDATWNPTRGCSRVGPECDNCYAMRLAHRHNYPAIEELGPNGEQLAGRPLQRREGAYHGLTVLRPKTSSRPGVDWSGVVRFVPEMLDDPRSWREPKRIFVDSMSDLFHEKLSWEREIDQVFGMMAALERHTFQVLTKRARNMRDYVNDWYRRTQTQIVPNIWLGVSCGNRKDGLPRLRYLRETPAAIRFLSIEPLLEDLGTLDLTGIHWVIVGGESGNGSRPFDTAWARDVIEQCRDAGVACFVKQLGKRPDLLLSHRKGGDMAEWPEDLRVRQFPEARP